MLDVEGWQLSRKRRGEWVRRCAAGCGDALCGVARKACGSSHSGVVSGCGGALRGVAMHCRVARKACARAGGPRAPWDPDVAALTAVTRRTRAAPATAPGLAHAWQRTASIGTRSAARGHAADGRRHRGCIPLEICSPTTDNNQIADIIDSSQRRLRRLYLTTGSSSRLWEPVSVCEHSVQAAAAASRDGADDAVVLACLLRDVSHLLALEAGAARDPEACATHEHARLGATFLGAIGFSDDVCWMVRHHMDAVRFLSATDPTYVATLSPGRVEALQSAGGPMPPDQRRALEADERWPRVLSMLTYDQVARKRVQRVSKEARDAQHDDWRRYLDKVIREHLRKNLLNSPLQKKIRLPDGAHAGSLLKIKDDIGGGAERRYEIVVPSGVGAGDVLRVILPGSERQMSSAFPLSQYARSYVLSWHQLRRLDEDGFVVLCDVLHPETVSD